VGKRNTYNSWVGKPAGNRMLGRHRCRKEENVKTHLQELKIDGVDWTHLSRDRNQWCVLVNMRKCGKCLDYLWNCQLLKQASARCVTTGSRGQRRTTHATETSCAKCYHNLSQDSNGMCKCPIKPSGKAELIYGKRVKTD